MQQDQLNSLDDKDPVNSLDDKGPAENLFSRSVKGGAWVVAFRIFTQILSLTRLIILSNMLEIADLGLLGVGLLMIQILNTFTQTGFQAALIQKKENVDDYLDTAWTLGMIRGIILFTILYFAAPYVALLKVEPEKVDLTIQIVRVIGISFLLGGLKNPGVLHFRKDMEFNKQFAYQIFGKLAEIIVSISIVLVYKTVWAIVFGRLTGAVINLAAGYIMHHHRPRFRFDRRMAGELWNFGRWIFAGTVLTFLLTAGDDLFVWGYLGVSSLALYQMAYRFCSIPVKEVTNVISQVTFPAYSKLQDDLPRLKEAYLKVLKFTAFLSVPVAGLIFIFARDFVTLFLKQEWQPIIPVMQVLAIKGLMGSLGATRGPLFKAVGRPWINMKLHVIRVIMLAVLIYPLTRRFGIVGTAMATTIIPFFVNPLGMRLAVKTIKCGFLDILRPIFFPLAATLTMLAVISVCRHAVFSEITFISFFSLAIIGICSFAATCYLCDVFFGYGIVRIIREQFKALAK